MTSAGQGLIVVHSKLKSDMRSELPSPLLLNIVTRWKHMISFVLLLRKVSDVTLDRSLVRP
jgi:hypothetical protein